MPSSPSSPPSSSSSQSSALSPQLKKMVAQEFSHLDSCYFNTAYFGPSPKRAKKMVEQALEKELDPSFYAFEDWFHIPERLREKLARLLNCSADHLTHSTSTSDLTNCIANGFAWQAGDVVASVRGEYPSNVLPWMLAEKRFGIRLALLDPDDPNAPNSTNSTNSPNTANAPDLPAQLAALGPRLKILNLSYVAFETGRKADLLTLGKYCQENDILFVVDATQALGGLPIDRQQLGLIDVLTCSSYKWMLGPYGHAFAYFSPKALKRISCTQASWTKGQGSQNVHDLLNYTTDTLSGARQYDRGQAANMLLMAALDGALDFLLEVGLANIEQHNRKVRDYFLKNLPQKKYQLIGRPESMANIICLKAKSARSPLALTRRLRQKGIDVSVREGNIRLSFHIFNEIGQAEQLLAALDGEL